MLIPRQLKVPVTAKNRPTGQKTEKPGFPPIEVTPHMVRFFRNDEVFQKKP